MAGRPSVALGAVGLVTSWSFHELAGTASLRSNELLKPIGGKLGGGTLKSSPPLVMSSPTIRVTGGCFESDEAKLIVLRTPYGPRGPPPASALTRNGTALTVRSAISAAGPAVAGCVSSRRAAVALSVMRRPMSPVLLPGVIVVPATLAPSERRKATVIGRAAGAVVALTSAVLPAMPSRFGSALLGGGVPGMREGTGASGGAAV